MIELALKGVMKYYGATMVLKNITFEVQNGEKVGLVGRNGCGKSTILKLIAKIEQVDKGDIMIKKGATVGYLDQIPVFPVDYTVEKVLNIAFEKLELIENNMSELEKKLSLLQGIELEKSLIQYSTLQAEYEALGGYEKEEKLSKVCIGLSFDENFLQRNFTNLSGGEKTTVILGKILLEKPEVLLLDEPTNHLDINALDWLEEYLKEYKGMVVIVSHDRYFLDRIVTKIIEIEDMESETYKGNYSKFVEEKENNLMIQFESFNEQQKKIKAMEKAIKDLRDWAIRADNNKFFRRAASMQKRLDKIDKIERPNLEKVDMKINIQNSERSGRDVIKVEALTKAFGEKLLFNEGELQVRYSEKVALIGGNGSGKSTFVKILLGEMEAEKGSAKLGANISYGYLPQQVNFQNEDITVLECFREGITITEGKAREYLAKFLFFGNSVFKKVRSLSGGEKSRLKLSKLLYEDVNLLILDEPTNHLDIDSIENLEEVLVDFKGTVFFISHDRYFINKLCHRVVSLENNKFVSYEGNYEYYNQKKVEKIDEESEKETIKKSPKVKVKAEDVDKKKENAKKKLEDNIRELEEQIKFTEEQMNLLGADFIQLEKCIDEKEFLERDLEKLMEQWLELE